MIESWYSICGRPILRSQSPAIHNYWFQLGGIPAYYFRLIADGTPAALMTYRKIGVAGFNVTAPFKKMVIPELGNLSPEAAAIGAVNLVLNRGNQWHGFNTDMAGVLGTLKAHAFCTGDHVLIIGAGGAARAALAAIKRLTNRIIITNRTDWKAQQLAQEFACGWVPFAERAAAVRAAQWVITTVTETDAILQPEWLQPHQVICDANYIHSNLAQTAAAVGCGYISGYSWLEHQAREVFRLFTGRSAPEALPDLTLPPAKGKRNNFALIGFMGSGKSNLGRKLAERLQWRFVDLDTVIEEEYGEQITTVFQNYGEEEFRRREAKMLSKVITGRNQVIACGGGVTTIKENCLRLQTAATVVFLYARPEAVEQRIDRATRPLLQGIDYRRKAKRLFQARLENYITTADAVIDTELYNLDQAEDLIYAEIEPHLDH